MFGLYMASLSIKRLTQKYRIIKNGSGAAVGGDGGGSSNDDNENNSYDLSLFCFFKILKQFGILPSLKLDSSSHKRIESKVVQERILLTYFLNINGKYDEEVKRIFLVLLIQKLSQKLRFKTILKEMSALSCVIKLNSVNQTRPD